MSYWLVGKKRKYEGEEVEKCGKNIVFLANIHPCVY